jgi:hypothetical protein
MTKEELSPDNEDFLRDIADKAEAMLGSIESGDNSVVSSEEATSGPLLRSDSEHERPNLTVIDGKNLQYPDRAPTMDDLNE